MKEYTVVTVYSDTVALADKVTGLLAQGWEVQGGIAVMGGYLLQALTRTTRTARTTKKSRAT